MKKIILLSAIVYFTSISGMIAQVINPIPSYDFHMTDPQALFGEIRVTDNGKEKRDMEVVISTANHSQGVYAKVWVVKKNGNIVKGPYKVYPYAPLSVPIDHGKWGVIVKCTWEVYVDVWIE